MQSGRVDTLYVQKHRQTFSAGVRSFGWRVKGANIQTDINEVDKINRTVPRSFAALAEDGVSALIASWRKL